MGRVIPFRKPEPIYEPLAPVDKTKLEGKINRIIEKIEERRRQKKERENPTEKE